MKRMIDLPDELVREVKLRAVVQRRSLKDLVTELIIQGLQMDARGAPERLAVSKRVEVGEKGLPIIRCNPKARATRMSAKALLKLEEKT